MKRRNEMKLSIGRGITLDEDQMERAMAQLYGYHQRLIHLEAKRGRRKKVS